MAEIKLESIDEFVFEDFPRRTESGTRQSLEDHMTFCRCSINVMFLLDTSQSMGCDNGRRINRLNTVVSCMLEQFRKNAEESEKDVFVRIIAFNDDASWVMGNMERGVDIHEACYHWLEPSDKGRTNTAAAIRLACTAMRAAYLGPTNVRTAVILITDGNSNDRLETKKAIEELQNALSRNNDNKENEVLRFAIGIGDYNEEELEDFAMMGRKEDSFGSELEHVPMVFCADIPSDYSSIPSVCCSFVLDDDLPPEDCVSVIFPI